MAACLSNESMFDLLGSDGKHFVWRQTGERLKPEGVTKSVKGLGGSVMLGMFSAAEVGSLIQMHGRVNTNVYQNLLQQHAVPSLQASPNQPAIFMKDNAPSHCKTAQRPDLNPIENI